MLRNTPDICRLDQSRAEQAAFLHFKHRHRTEKHSRSLLRQTVTPTQKVFSQLGTHGFSLIEMMVAMTLFAIVSLGVYPLMWTNIQTNTKNSFHRAAETAAVRWMDTLSARGYSGLVNVAETSDPLDSNFTYQVVVTTNAVNDRKVILLTIRWSLGRNSYDYRIQTIKVRNS